MTDLIDPGDLTDAAGVAEVLGLANRTSVSVYQRRYPEMPRPVVDLGSRRTKLWSRTAVESWATSADRRSPQAVTGAELAQLAPEGEPLAKGIFRSTFVAIRQHALGGGKEAREIARSRRAAYDLALSQAVAVDPTFRVAVPDDWFGGA
ncbi:MAG: hypothetical protein ACRDZR_09395 [Acidimicrobiales bacterium]